MTAKKQTRPRTPAAKKAATSPRVPRKAPQDHRPKLEVVQEAQPLTAEDYKINTGVLLQVLGIEPGTVKEGSVHLSFPGGTPVLEYQVVRGVPARALGVAILRSATKGDNNKQEGEAGEPSG